MWLYFRFSIVYPVLVCHGMERETRKTFKLNAKTVCEIEQCVQNFECRDFSNSISRSAFSRAEYIHISISFFSWQKQLPRINTKHICNSCCILGFVFRHNFLHLIVSWIVLLFIHRAERHVIITKNSFSHSHRPHSNLSRCIRAPYYGNTISYICLLLFFHPFAWLLHIFWLKFRNVVMFHGFHFI